MALRSPTSDELRLLEVLIRKSRDFVVPENWRKNLMVADMQDGGMGSLQLVPNGLKVEGRSFGKLASDCQFTDADGVEVIASLNLDQDGNLYELDIWKTNFGKLIQVPPQLVFNCIS